MTTIKFVLVVAAIGVILCPFNLFAAKEVMPIYTPGVGGGLYFLGGALASVVNKYVPEVQLMVEPVGGALATVKYMEEKSEKKQGVFGMSNSSWIYAAYKGIKPFTKEYKALRAITFVQATGVNLVVEKESPIKSYFDAKGKKIALGAPGSGTAEIATALLEAHGLPKTMYKPQWLGYKEVVEGIQDGSIHGGFIAGPYPIAAMKELSLRKKIRVIPVDPAVLKKILAENPYYTSEVLKADAYNGMDKETTILVFGSILVTHSGMDPELVYNVTKTIFERRDELIATQSVAEQISLQNATKTIRVPFHPGAEKYLREKGVKIIDMK
jgi:TRAP transporter TAXI family solute receptor